MSRPPTVWQARTGTPPADPLIAYGETTTDDEPFVLLDLAGSIAHTLGLLHAGLITDDEALDLIDGLQALGTKAQAGELTLDPGLEDVHMNVEAQLKENIGPVADKLHTGRSRNDQVALDLVLYTRLGLVDLAGAALSVAGSLAETAHAHTTTPWVAKTHGQDAQPATLGLLLHAHAIRFQDLASLALDAADHLDESPLGSGAVAGSTLPLDPALTANLLGLAPPRNALLATSSRDGTIHATQLASLAGLAAASLATDLIELADDGSLSLPPAYTTGSSLMPHKRNPDALELVRAHGKGLSAPMVQVTSLVAGLGLGYHRDLQATKPCLTDSLTVAIETLGVLGGVVDGVSIDPTHVPSAWHEPSIRSTDAVEVLVQAGVPFRQAYGTLAGIFAQLEEGASLVEAIEASELTDDHAVLVHDALTGEPTARETLGGPGPVVLVDALEAFDEKQGTLEQACQRAHQETSAPLDLLEQPAKLLVADILEGV